ncbi:MAG: hypothetical protein ACF8NJ_05925 [Phycisphaerales bacterium JB038]
MIAIREDPDRVEPGHGCPACGERNVDSLQWLPDELVKCLRCGARYCPGSPVKEVNYCAWDDELIQRLVPARGPPYERYCSVGSLEVISNELDQWLSPCPSEEDLLGSVDSWGVAWMECRAALGFLAASGLVERQGQRYRPAAPNLAEAAVGAFTRLQERGSAGETR